MLNTILRCSRALTPPFEVAMLPIYPHSKPLKILDAIALHPNALSDPHHLAARGMTTPTGHAAYASITRELDCAVIGVC